MDKEDNGAGDKKGKKIYGSKRIKVKKEKKF